jgi:heme/copper-type cytochrome/quinol oxidase subunit 3
MGPQPYGLAQGATMSAHAEDGHHHERPFDQWPDDVHTGQASMGKIGMWIFLLSDALTFAGFLLAYGILRGGSDQWIMPSEPQEFGINFTAGLTFLLICSSVTMVMAYAACVDGNRKRTVQWLLATILGGTLFLCGQMQEYFGAFEFIFHHEGLIADGLIFGTSHRANTFYLITGFHGMHVFTGTTYLCIICFRTWRGKYDGGNYNHIEMCGLFWHFVDLVWILVFTFIYLIPA